VDERRGFWGLTLHEVKLEEPEHGLLYLGKEVRPAVRLSYTERIKGKSRPATTILSFPSEHQREQVLAMLSRPPEPPQPEPAPAPEQPPAYGTAPATPTGEDPW
jgi:hypothetical protein